MKIENFKSNNLYYSQLLAWRKNRFSTEELKESFEPIESKWGSGNILANDIFDNPTIDENKKFDKYWINEISARRISSENFSDYLKKVGMDEGLVDEIVDSAFLMKDNLKGWSSANESIGKKASRFAFLSLVAGVIKQVFFNHDKEIAASNPSDSPRNDVLNEDYKTMGPWDYISKTVDIFYSLFRSQRNLHQYTMYSLPDDDAAMNVYQADVYGNKIAGGLAEMSTFMETKINPLLIPLSEFLPKNLGEYFRKLAVLPASLWWRARMPAYINQEFFTDFLKYIWHKPMSFLGYKYSNWQLENIEKRGNLNWAYFVRRHKENLGISNKRYEIATSNPADSPRNDVVAPFVKKLSGSPPLPTSGSLLLSHFCNLFNKDSVKQAESAKRLGEFAAPVLGMYGFFTSALGNTSNAICKLFNVENTFSKISNLIQASSIYSQQLIYLPKIMIPFLSETRMIGKLINDPNVEKTEQLKDLYKKRQVISGVGLGSFLLHTINIALKPCRNLPWQVSYFDKLKSIVDEIACNLTNIFFSNRRHLMGYQFRIENPEFVD